MAITIWWHQRLAQGFPLWGDPAKLDSLDVRRHKGAELSDWPRAVLRGALYENYRLWYKTHWREMYEGFPTPPMISELVFYAAMHPWLYVVGKKEQVRYYPVSGEEKSRYYVRLCELRHHRAVFNMSTGLDWNERPVERDLESAQIVAESMAEYKRAATQRRALWAP